MKAWSEHTEQKYLPTAGKSHGIALCLSGGGYRAIAFHLGVLHRLNEFGLLSRVSTVSAVGHASIVAGFLGRVWQDLKTDRDGVFSNLGQAFIRPLERLTGETVTLGSRFWERFKPWKWAKLRNGDHTTTDLLASYYDRKVFRGFRMSDLPPEPRFVFGATNLRTGGLWQFTRTSAGELLLGYTSRQRVLLAEVVAASSANPAEFPPLVMRYDAATFEHGLLGPRAEPLRRAVLLTDGSLQDSLAIEGVWKDHELVLVADAGGVLPVESRYRDWLGARLLRSLQITGQQSLEARKRWLIHSFTAGAVTGAYIGLSTYHGHYGQAGSVGYPNDVVEQLSLIPADQCGLTEPELGALANHGYTITDTALRRYLSDRLPVEATLRLPYPDFVDRNKVLTALSASPLPLAA